MAGRRPLTRPEERALIRIARRLRPRDRALVTALWSTSFRISEILALPHPPPRRNRGKNRRRPSSSRFTELTATLPNAVVHFRCFFVSSVSLCFVILFRV